MARGRGSVNGRGPITAQTIEKVVASLELEPLMRKAFRMTIESADDIDGPLADAVNDEARRTPVQTLSTRVAALSQIVRSRVAPALELAVGFNALDGD